VLLLSPEEAIGRLTVIGGGKFFLPMEEVCGSKAMVADYKDAERKLKGFDSVSNGSPTVNMVLHIFEEFYSDFAIIIIDETRGHVLPHKFDQDRYGPRLSSGPVWIVQGRGDCGSRQEPMSFWLSIFLRDKISFYI